MTESTQLNVFGEPLEVCCQDPMTGFFRDRFCHTDDRDAGVHTVCARVTVDFLQFSKAAGNDLSTPRPEFGFPGLVDGDGWCLCAGRWREAYDAGKAPGVYLRRTHQRTLEVVPLEWLKAHALDLE